MTLEFVANWRGERPTTCRHCGDFVAFGAEAVADGGNPWLVIHADCLRQLVRERIVVIYDRLSSGVAIGFDERRDMERELAVLAEEVQWVREILEGQRKGLTGMFRPGIRREPPPRRGR